MSESPKFRIVGGTDYTPKASLKESSPVEKTAVTPRMLITRWIDITSNLPVNFLASTRPERVAEAKLQVVDWSVEQLYKYIDNTDKWKRPSFTKAVLDEISDRMKRQDFEVK